MKLSLREAAVVLGCPERTLRSRAARGEIACTKVGRSWRFERDALPLTVEQRRVLDAREQDVRDVVEESLADRRRKPKRTLLDNRAIRPLCEVLRRMSSPPHSGHTHAPAVEAALRDGLLDVAAANYEFRHDLKLDALRRARSSVAHAVALLMVDVDTAADTEIRAFIECIESDVIAPIGGLIRWCERRQEASR